MACRKPDNVLALGNTRPYADIYEKIAPNEYWYMPLNYGARSKRGRIYEKFTRHRTPKKVTDIPSQIHGRPDPVAGAPRFSIQKQFSKFKREYPLHRAFLERVLDAS